MRRLIILVLSLTFATAGSSSAETFERSPIAPELGVDALTRGVARERVGRDVFANPYATATIANVDVYDRFPYVESRRFQIVSDPQWNRLVYGEAGRSLRAYDGRGTTLGPLANPRGLAVDDQNRVYVADTDHDRIVVLQASTELGDITLVPLYAISGLNSPYDVAVSDGGTPFHPGDDALVVANTGRNEVVAFALDGTSARRTSAVGSLGSGVGRFAGPLAITFGRSGGANTRDVYVADAHNQRIVRLGCDAGVLSWTSEAHQDADVVTSLDADEWGNVYATAPNRGVVRKLNPDLGDVTELKADLVRPRSFHVPFATVRDHRNGSLTRVGQPNGVSVAQWSDQSGIELWNLGVAVQGLGVQNGAQPTARFNLTDRADVTVEISDAQGRSLARRSMGTLAAGVHDVPLAEARGLSGAGDLVLRVSASSPYPNHPSDFAQTAFRLNGSGGVVAPSRPMLLGNAPNPIRWSTRIAFILPDSREASLQVFDAMGRRVRTFGNGFTVGMNEVVWNGADDSGRMLRAGVYVARLEVGGERFSRSMVLVR